MLQCYKGTHFDHVVASLASQYAKEVLDLILLLPEQLYPSLPPIDHTFPLCPSHLLTTPSLLYASHPLVTVSLLCLSIPLTTPPYYVPPTH